MRGMMKWLPFKSLKGQYEILEAYEREKEKVVKPELSDDKIEEINYKLVSLKPGDKVKVKYYSNGFIKEAGLSFLSYDSLTDRLKFQTISLNTTDILDLN